MKMMKKNRLKTSDWTLLAISLVPKKGLSPVRLQKSLFLLGEGFPKVVGKHYYEFIPYNYGPFCADIYDDVGKFILSDYVKEIGVPNQRWSEYFITQKGKKYVEKLPLDYALEAFKYLNQVIEWAQGLTFHELISAIYKAYPKFKKNSVF